MATVTETGHRTAEEGRAGRADYRRNTIVVRTTNATRRTPNPRSSSPPSPVIEERGPAGPEDAVPSVESDAVPPADPWSVVSVDVEAGAVVDGDVEA